MSPLLVEALKALTRRVNLKTGLAHPADESAAKELFVKLRNHGEPLSGSQIASWAYDNGWSDEHSSNLGDVAQRIGEGRRVRIDAPNRWKPEIIQILQDRVDENA